MSLVTTRFVRLLSAALLGIVLLGGCEEEVIDAEKTPQPFTLYGYLDPRGDEQVVRVFPVQHLLEPVGPSIDADVRFLDLEQGVTHAAADSVVAFPSGEYGHVFNSRFRPRYGSTYRVEVVRSDGAGTVADVTVPADVEVDSDSIFTTRSFESPDPQPHISVLLAGEPTWIATITAIYDVAIVDANYAIRQLFLSYDYAQVKVAGGWRIHVDLANDLQRIRDELAFEFTGAVQDFDIEFLRLRLQVDVVNEGWFPPTGRFDPELLVEPGVMSNVENGFGFIGSGYRVTEQIDPSACILFWGGYSFAADPCEREDWCRYAGFRCD